MKRPYFIVVIVASISILVGIVSYADLIESKKDLESLLVSESVNLVKTLKYSVENNINSSSLIQKTITDKLVSSSSHADHINHHKAMKKGDIVAFAEENELDMLIIEHDEKIKSNFEPELFLEDLPQLKVSINIIKNDDYFWFEIGNVSFRNEDYFLIGGKFYDDRTVIICGVKEEKLSDLRKQIGIGRLLNNYSKNPDITYVVLQDSFGIIAATSVLKDNSLPEDGDFIGNLYQKHYPDYRFTDFQGLPIIEAAIRAEADNNTMVVRLAISLEKINAINHKATMSFVYLIVGMIALTGFTWIAVLMHYRHRRLEEHSKQMTQYTDLMLSNINDAVIGVGKNDEILIYNKKAEMLFGAKPSSGKYKHLFDEDILGISEAISNGNNTPYKEFKSKESTVLAFTTSVVYNSISQVEIVIAIIRDITHIKNETELKNREEKVRATGALAAGVAHEIRNPMNAINIIAQRLELEFEPIDYKQEYIELVSIIRDEIDRIDGIIEQFIQFSAIKPTALRQANICGITQKAVNLMSPLANSKNINIEFLHKDHLDCFCDEDKIEQVVINLIKNAIDSIEENGKIKIVVASDDKKIILAIEDNGKGIPEEMKAKVFDLYFSTKKKGMGLGLGIVSKIISDHGGKIYFKTFNNIGTTFFVELPRTSNNG